MELKTVSTSSMIIKIISDIHLGHPKMETTHVIQTLKKIFPYDDSAKEIDFVFITGDLFDDILMVKEEVMEIVDWITYFLAWAQHYKIAVRLLKGTPSHDYDQPKIMERLAKSGVYPDLDFKYFDKIDIEHNERFDKYFLYVPDEINPETSTTLEVVRAMMAARGIKQVDYAFMHGFFDFQLPEFRRKNCHDSAAYRALVKHRIFIGHDHTSKSLDNFIYVPGSPDRDRHNREEPKGHLHVVEQNGDVSITFVVNHDAKRFDTIDCKGLDFEQAKAKVLGIVVTLPEESHVRIRAQKGDLILSYVPDLKRAFLHIHFTTDAETFSDAEVTEEVPVDTYVSLQIVQTNIKELILNRIQKKTTDTTILELADKFIDEGLMAL